MRRQYWLGRCFGLVAPVLLHFSELKAGTAIALVGLRDPPLERHPLLEEDLADFPDDRFFPMFLIMMAASGAMTWDNASSRGCRMKFVIDVLMVQRATDAADQTRPKYCSISKNALTLSISSPNTAIRPANALSTRRLRSSRKRRSAMIDSARSNARRFLTIFSIMVSARSCKPANRKTEHERSAH